MEKKINLRTILTKRKTSEAANAGFWAGIIAGFLQAIFCIFTIVWFKDILLKEFMLAKRQLGMLIPYDINTLYIITLIVGPPAIIFLYLVAGIIFGLIFDRMKSKNPLSVLMLSVLFGIGFGLITNLPISRFLIIIASIISWLIFAFVFLMLYTKRQKESKNRQKKGKVLMFLLLIFILSSLLTIISYLLSVKLISLAPLYMFIPLVATFIICYFYNIPLAHLGLSLKLNKWLIMAWLLPAFLSLATLGISLLFPSVEYSANLEGLSRYNIPPTITKEYASLGIPPLLYFLIIGLIAGPTINTLFAFGEEIGWRGFLQRELSKLGFWKSSFLIGLIWGVWHSPLILQGYNYPQHPIIGIFLMIIFCILLSPIFSFIRIKTDSVIAASIMHGSLNAFAGISIAFVKGSDLIVGIHSLSGFIVLVIVNLLIKILSKVT